MPKQISLKLNTTFIENKPAGLAAKYLNSGEIDVRTGIEIAIGCLFAPLGAAISGSNRKEVDALIQTSRTQFEIYLSLALSRCHNELIEDKTVSVREDNSAIDFDIEENIDFESEDLS